MARAAKSTVSTKPKPKATRPKATKAKAKSPKSPARSPRAPKPPGKPKKLYFEFAVCNRHYKGIYSYTEFLENCIPYLRNQYSFLPKELLIGRAKKIWEKKATEEMEKEFANETPIQRKVRLAKQKPRSPKGAVTTRSARLKPLDLFTDSDDVVEHNNSSNELSPVSKPVMKSLMPPPMQTPPRSRSSATRSKLNLTCVNQRQNALQSTSSGGESSPLAVSSGDSSSSGSYAGQNSSALMTPPRQTRQGLAIAKKNAAQSPTITGSSASSSNESATQTSASNSSSSVPTLSSSDDNQSDSFFQSPPKYKTMVSSMFIRLTPSRQIGNGQMAPDTIPVENASLWRGSNVNNSNIQREKLLTTTIEEVMPGDTSSGMTSTDPESMKSDSSVVDVTPSQIVSQQNINRSNRVKVMISKPILLEINRDANNNNQSSDTMSED